MLYIDQVTKVYGKQIALDDLSLSLTNGVVALVGQNGSGKSTLLRILATLLKPDSGDIRWGRLHYRRDLRQLRTQIGYLPQDLELPQDMTLDKLLTYLAQIRENVPEQSVEPIIRALKLEEVAHKQLGTLSGGELRLVGIAQALLCQPQLCLLDEAFRGLSVEERERVISLIQQQSGLTLFSTHIPVEAERVAQSVLVLHQGRVRFYGKIDALISSARGAVYEMTVPTSELSEYLHLSAYTVSRVHQSADETRIRMVGIPSNGMARIPVEPSLEDAYLLLLKQGLQYSER